MGLKSAMERLEGANAQLREQVRLCRQEEERSSAASQRLRSRLAAAEAELKAIKGGFMEQPPAQVDKPPCLNILFGAWLRNSVFVKANQYKQYYLF